MREIDRLDEEKVRRAGNSLRASRRDRAVPARLRITPATFGITKSGVQDCVTRRFYATLHALLR
jgi:hypothetical protein